MNLGRWGDEPLLADPASFARSLEFTAVLMGILLAHELGHVAAAARHRFRVSLPWFLPLPFLVGTLGAIIVPREAPRDRDGLLEMGAAGPLTGLLGIVAALALVAVAGGVEAPVRGDPTLGVPLLFRILGVAPHGVSMRDPVAFAAWIGCLVTAMNLLPFGQLDGGHVVSALWPDLAGGIAWTVTGVLLVAGLWWPGWAVWAALLHLLGTRHPLEPRRRDVAPGGRARAMAACCAVAFVMCATPVPIRFA